MFVMSCWPHPARAGLFFRQRKTSKADTTNICAATATSYIHQLTFQAARQVHAIYTLDLWWHIMTRSPHLHHEAGRTGSSRLGRKSGTRPGN